MNLPKMKEPDHQPNHLIRFRPAGPALEPYLTKTTDTALHPTFDRKEDPPRPPFPEDEDCREYYRLR